MDLWLTRDRDDLLTLHYFEKPVKKEEIGQWWQLMFTEGDSIILPMAKKSEFPWVKWEDKEPTKVSLVPNKILEQCEPMSKNVACVLQKLDLAMSRKDPKDVCQSLDEMTMLYARMIKFLVELSGYLEE